MRAIYLFPWDSSPAWGREVDAPSTFGFYLISASSGLDQASGVKPWPKPPAPVEICKTSMKGACWAPPGCSLLMQAQCLVAWWRGWPLSPLHTCFWPLTHLVRTRLATAQSHTPHPFWIQHSTIHQCFKHFLNYVAVSTPPKMGLHYTIKGEMYKLSDVVSICSSTWNYTGNRRLLSEKSIFLSFLWRS